VKGGEGMLLKYAFQLLISISLFFPGHLFAQEGKSSSAIDTLPLTSCTDSLQNSQVFEWTPSTSVFVELLGKGFLSLNVDFRWKESYSISIGFQPLEGLMPDIMYYHFSGERRRFEIGGGLSAGFTKNLSLAVVLINGVVGYRYQKKNGLFFRAGFTPFYSMFLDEPDRNRFIPLAGLSLGYSF
jgi:hypothetical protein